jgi:PDZ domain-containing protein
VSVALAATLVFLAIRPVPYVIFSPGSARSVEPLVTIRQKAGGPKPLVEAPDDNILFVTVSITYPNGALVLVKARDPYAQIGPKKLYLGTQSEEQNRTYNLSLMTDAKDTAAKVALTEAGYDVPVTYVGAVFVDVDPSFPAAKVLQPGDTVVAADGTKVATDQDLIDAIAAHRPGDEIELQIERLGVEGEISVKAPLVENKAKPGKAQLGVSLATRPKFTFPVDISIDSGDVGGPSAGLAFTLALIDRLTEGDLTGGTRVAVTGTIELDGSVGPVGGVRQKTRAAISAGAKVFLVPPDEYQDAVAAAGGRLKVEQVSSVAEALVALRRLGGDPVEPVADASAGG